MEIEDPVLRAQRALQLRAHLRDTSKPDPEAHAALVAAFAQAAPGQPIPQDKEPEEEHDKEERGKKR